ncbi:MAG: 50S ribosomal protein L25 [Ferrimicrobium sp.]
MVKVVGEQGRAIGSAESRRLRRTGQVPAVLYGTSIDPMNLAVNAHDFQTALGHRVTPGTLMDLEVAGTVRLVKLQAVQRHPVRRDLSHLDFLAVAAGDSMEISVELSTTSAELQLRVASVVLRGTPAVLPSELVVDDSMAGEDGTIHARSLILPKGVQLVTEADTVVAKMGTGE